jgi:hypothetical protein
LVVVKGNDGTTSGIPLGFEQFGVWGDSKDHDGVLGTTAAAADGYGAGVKGISGSGPGVWGIGMVHSGIFGEGHSGVAGLGSGPNSFAGGDFRGPYGVYADGNDIGVFSKGGNYGVVASSPANSISGGIGLLAESFFGTAVYGYLAGLTAGAITSDGRGIINQVTLASVYSAGEFSGNVSVSGFLNKAGGGFKIDHPRDPANKYLLHSFVESPDMKNIYDGIVTLDQDGKAEVELPNWFDTLNQDFRYQLTAIGSPGPNLYIEEEIVGNSFKIAGGKHGMKVSWQITGIRKDPWASKNRVKIEEEKPSTECGYYIHPELYDKPSEKNVLWAHYPDNNDRLKKMQDMVEEVKRQDTTVQARIHKVRDKTKNKNK